MTILKWQALGFYVNWIWFNELVNAAKLSCSSYRLESDSSQVSAVNAQGKRQSTTREGWSLGCRKIVF